jgi:peptidyl-prolyl cis-trans isomerase D
MMKFLRSQSQTVLVLILVVIGGSFLFYGNVGNLLTSSTGRGSDFGRIDNQDLSVAELYQAVRITRDGLIMSGRAQDLAAPGGRAALAQEAWRQLLLLHEADRLHVEISDQELINYIQSQSIFQKDGVYSPDLYQQQMTTLQNKFHISPDDFETVLRNNLRSDAVSRALFSPVRAGGNDIEAEYQKYFGPTQVTLVTFDLKTIAATIKVSPEEVGAEYKAHPEDPAYRTPEKRKVDYVLLSLTAEQEKLPDKEKAAAIEALGEKALDFALSLQPDPANGGNSQTALPDFEAAAKKKGLEVKTTDFFATDAPPSGLPPSPAFNNTAFALTKDDPVSKVVELDNGVAVLHLNDIQMSELKPLDQVKSEIVEKLQQAKAAAQLQLMAAISAVSLKQAVAAGTDFKKAAEAQKLSVQTLPAFIPANTPESDQRLQTIAYMALQLSVGGVSQAVPIETDNSTVIVHLDSRAPADPAGLSDFETRYRSRQDEGVRNSVYLDWADWMSKRPGTHKPPDLDQYGGVD